MQIWTPPYLLNGKPRPTIDDAPKTLSYAKSFTFGFSGVSAVDRVVINRVISATHGNHFDQRQVRVIATCAGVKLSVPESEVSEPLLDSQRELQASQGLC